MRLSAGDSSRDGKHRRLRRSAIAAFTRLPPPARRSILHALGKYAPWEEGFERTPPRVATGEVIGDPDFVGIGTQKAGTTWWYGAICAHPAVYARPDIHKERHFFDRYAMCSFGPDDADEYRGWFPHPPDKLCGEWTPDYLNMPWVPDLLSRAAPRTRLLVILRDPVDRISSALAHIRSDMRNLRPVDYADAVTRGFYHESLCRWLRYFPYEQILVLQYERCLLDPVGQLRRTYEFLGLEPVVPEGLDKRINPSSDVPKLDQETQRRLAQVYLPDIRALCNHFPDIDPGLWASFRP